MLKNVLSIVLIAGSLSGVALAQTAGSGSTNGVAPAGQAAAGTGGTAGPGFLSRQDSGQVLAGSLIGASVTASDGEKVGTVKDLIIDTGGRAAGVVVTHGGVLGVGGKEVGVPFEQVKIGAAPYGEEKVLRLSMSMDQFDAAPEFKDAAELDEERPNASERMKKENGAAAR